MPNHVTNEITFTNADETEQARIMAAVCGDKGIVDFSILLPVPINCWQFSCGRAHEKAFRVMALDWCRQN